MAAKSIGHRPGPLVFINLQNGTAVESRRSAEELRQAEARIAEIAAKIRAGEFEPRPNSACERCSYYSICPAHEEPLPHAAAESAISVS